MTGRLPNRSWPGEMVTGRVQNESVVREQGDGNVWARLHRV